MEERILKLSHSCMPQINLPGGPKLQGAGNQSCRPRESEVTASLEILFSVTVYLIVIHVGHSFPSSPSIDPGKQ